MTIVTQQPTARADKTTSHDNSTIQYECIAHLMFNSVAHPVPITTDRAQFLEWKKKNSASSDMQNEAKALVESLGFEILKIDGFMITLAGPDALFDKIFNRPSKHVPGELPASLKAYFSGSLIYPQPPELFVD